MGFVVEYGREIEKEYYNFDALNIPTNHASRVDFDTFYVDDDVLLRSQTSTVQIRTMEKQNWKRVMATFDDEACDEQIYC